MSSVITDRANKRMLQSFRDDQYKCTLCDDGPYDDWELAKHLFNDHVEVMVQMNMEYGKEIERPRKP